MNTNRNEEAAAHLQSATASLFGALPWSHSNPISFLPIRVSSCPFVVCNCMDSVEDGRFRTVLKVVPVALRPEFGTNPPGSEPSGGAMSRCTVFNPLG